MRLVTLLIDGAPRAGVVLANGNVLDLAEAAREAPGAAGEAVRTASLQSIIEAGPEALDLVRTLADRSARSAQRRPEDHVTLAPLPSPAKNVFCVGRNYAEHIAEGDRAQNQKVGVTEHPVFFTKPRTAVIGPGAAIPIFPHVSTSIDYEVELALVIGRRGRDIAREDAFDHILGYTIVNDVSARDIQRRHGGQYFKGKGLDGSCPMGPCIVTADEIGDPGTLAISLTVNGETRQSSTTAAMIFDIPTLIASLSAGMTLEPGDILATGTPSGVGYAMDPPRFLTDGDVVVCTIENIGKLENHCRVQ
jgi:2-keto-4-pentenoate hydratase/2-oxohepta-3-ene-1,7-dioic acid hydratase in catechol pathway